MADILNSNLITFENSPYYIVERNSLSDANQSAIELESKTLMSHEWNYFYQENLKNLYYDSSIIITAVGWEFN